MRLLWSQTAKQQRELYTDYTAAVGYRKTDHKLVVLLLEGHNFDADCHVLVEPFMDQLYPEDSTPFLYIPFLRCREPYILFEGPLDGVFIRHWGHKSPLVKLRNITSATKVFYVTPAGDIWFYEAQNQKLCKFDWNSLSFVDFQPALCLGGFMSWLVVIEEQDRLVCGAGGDLVDVQISTGMVQRRCTSLQLQPVYNVYVSYVVEKKLILMAKRKGPEQLIYDLDEKEIHTRINTGEEVAHGIVASGVGVNIALPSISTVRFGKSSNVASTIAARYLAGAIPI